MKFSDIDFDSIVYFIPTRKSIFSVTFDDGPTPGVTDKVLEELSQYKTKGTFFMVGENVKKNPSLAKEVVSTGNQIGIHSYKHKRGMTFWSQEDIEDDFSRAKEVIAEVTGVAPTLVRPPFGNVSSNILQACSSLKLKYVGWSLNTKDWLGGRKIPYGLCTRGSIVLFHDGGRISSESINKTIKPLRLMLESQMECGNSSTTIDDLVSSQDDSIILHFNEVGHSLLGCSQTMVDNHYVSVCYWSVRDVFSGLSYEIDDPTTSKNRIPVLIPPMANVDNWFKPIEVAVGDVMHPRIVNVCKIS